VILSRQVNQTSHDWPMVARIEGTGFKGPSSITAKAYTTTQYPLSFKPQFEGIVEVSPLDGLPSHKEL